MNSNDILHWVSIFAGIVLSWPVVGIIALYIFKKPLIGIFKQFSDSGLTKAKFGPVELEKQIVELKDKVEGQRDEQERQKNEIEILRFLIFNFLTRHELSHLKKFSDDEDFPYQKASYFMTELRRLRSLGLIEGGSIAALPEKGNLKDYFKITPNGLYFLKLRNNRLVT